MKATRNQWSKKFAEELANLNADAPDYTCAPGIIRGRLMESLEPAQRELYDYVSQDDKPVTTNRIAVDFQLQPNHASGLLKSLWELGLLTRKLVIDDRGKRYEYRRATP